MVASNFSLTCLSKTFSILALSASLAFFGQPAQKASAQLSLAGAGATSIQPLVADWFTNQGVTYGLVGSGAGRTQFGTGTPTAIDFASTDLSLTGLPADLVVINPVNIPVSFVYNIDGATSPISLSTAQACNIIAGNITDWNTIDPTIPSTPIQFVYRSDSSGTTDILNGFVATNCSGFSVPPFTVGTGVVGSSGIINTVKATNGAIGYVDTPAAVVAGSNIATVDTKIEGPNYFVFRGTYGTPDKAADARKLCNYVFSPVGRAYAASKGYTLPNAFPNLCNAIKPL